MPTESTDFFVLASGIIVLASTVILLVGLAPTILSLLRSHGCRDSTKGEFWLACLALLTGGVAPIFLLLTATTAVLFVLTEGQFTGIEVQTDLSAVITMLNKVSATYVPLVLLPSLVILISILLYSFTRYPRLANRLIVGMGAGVLATLGLDVVRLLGVRLGWLPFDMPPMFGLIILGPAAPPAAGALVGYGYHFLNGADFGLVYALAVGRVRWAWGLLWGAIIWLGMMVTPPMVVMGAGPFGIGTASWPAYLLTTLLAHQVWGGALGLLTARFVCEPEELLRRYRMTKVEEERRREEEQATPSERYSERDLTSERG